MWIMCWASMYPVRRDKFAPTNTDKLNIFCSIPLIIKFGVCIVCIEHSISDLEHLSQLILHDDKNSKYYIINLVIQLWLTFISLQSIQTLSKLHHIDQQMSYLIWNKVFFAIYLENFVKHLYRKFPQSINVIIVYCLTVIVHFFKFVLQLVSRFPEHKFTNDFSSCEYCTI